MASFTTKQPEILFYTTCPDSPAGKLLIGMSEDNRLCRIGFIGKSSIRCHLEAWQDKWPRTNFVKASKTLSFQNLKKKPLLLVGTEFQQRVWRGLLTIPTGKTLSYGQLAQKIKKPKAARAVGNACGKNPIPLLVPCHRIIAGNGTIGGFSSDPAIKMKLLRTEKVTQIT